MIEDRPGHLMKQGRYGRHPTAPFGIKLFDLPELLRESLLPLGGIQPVN
jgi:hypothetical protein